MLGIVKRKHEYYVNTRIVTNFSDHKLEVAVQRSDRIRGVLLYLHVEPMKIYALDKHPDMHLNTHLRHAPQDPPQFMAI